MEFTLLSWLVPIGGGLLMNWVAGRCKGRNARTAFRFASWGFFLLLLLQLTFLLPFPLSLPIIKTVVALLPSAFMFLMAGNSMLKEMRAQKEGNFTDVA